MGLGTSACSPLLYLKYEGNEKLWNTERKNDIVTLRDVIFLLAGAVELEMLIDVEVTLPEDASGAAPATTVMTRSEAATKKQISPLGPMDLRTLWEAFLLTRIC